MTFQDPSDHVLVRDFTYFNYLFRAAYAAYLHWDSSPEIDCIEKYNSQVLGDFKSHLASIYHSRKIAEHFFLELYDKELAFSRIKKDSPIEIMIIGVVSALTVAVILSGGEVEYKDLKFKINSLGSGIKSLREAFSIKDEKRKPMTWGLPSEEKESEPKAG
jgi:hypothetical protein